MSERLTALTAPQLAAVEGLLEGRTEADAAASAAVDLRTVRRWLAQPQLRAALHQERAAIAAEVRGRLQAAAIRTVQALGAALLIVQLADRAIRTEARSLQRLAAITAAAGNEPTTSQRAVSLSLCPLGGSNDEEGQKNRTKPDKTGQASRFRRTRARLRMLEGKVSLSRGPDGSLRVIRFVRTGHARPHLPEDATEDDIRAWNLVALLLRWFVSDWRTEVFRSRAGRWFITRQLGIWGHSPPFSSPADRQHLAARVRNRALVPGHSHRIGRGGLCRRAAVSTAGRLVVSQASNDG